jgi:hypothetical protein
MTRAAASILTALAALAGCAAPGPYPSLALRDVERTYAAGDPVAPPPVVPDRSGLGARVQALVAAGGAADAGFERALAAARSLAGRAGAAGSEGWIAAQQAVSRAEAARAATVRALADLDALAIAEAAEPLSAADYERLTAGLAALQAATDRQQRALDGLRASLRGS